MELVLDTNIFVAASFSPNSASGRIVRAIRQEQHVLVWNKATKRETKRILKKIPPVSWSQFKNLFMEKSEYKGKVDSGGLNFIAAFKKTTGFSPWMNRTPTCRPLLERNPALLDGEDVIKDKEDIKFAALARAAGAVLVTNDDHLLSVRNRLDFSCMTSGEFSKKNL